MKQLALASSSNVTVKRKKTNILFLLYRTTMGEEHSLTFVYGALTIALSTPNPAVMIAGIAGLTVGVVACAIAGCIMSQKNK